ncbi:MBL fold metallo-hydrolase [Microlunatus flavus]|uniref:Ribonuclease BN, tRNA processing enzyme n=1 Tax=Microlunatus flavus TaxID=1036181 RepID=A0A1H9CNQ5_9ACTN|nr:MBL fold metallo-hydrolase [Microlunatus flavus]SEQ02842.1 Ribonuclease BN, tRNA processing enzyme [Microlunatus flavus]
MRLTVVGCSGSVSGPASPASSYLVQAPYEGRAFSLVLDLGPGAFGALHRHLDPSAVDAYGFSHLHPDHCLDLCGAYVAARYSPTAPWPRVPVHAPADAGARFARAYDVAPRADRDGEGGVSIADWFGYRTWRPEQEVGPFRVATAPVDHPVEAYAVRVTEAATGASLVYSGDTGPCDTLVDLARGEDGGGVDLLLAEAAFLDGPGLPSGVHLTGSQAAIAATRAGARSLLLTHIPPWHDPQRVLAEARPHFAGPVSLAVTDAVREVRPR